MKKNQYPLITSRTHRWKDPRQFAQVCAVSICLLVSTTLIRAGTFFSDFNSGVLPTGTAVFGVATNDLVGGFTNSGCLKLTTTIPSVVGSFVITNDLDAGAPVVSFTANFKVLIGGGSAADGFGFSFAPDLPFGPFSEEGAGTVLSVEFDTYDNGAPDTAPSIDVWVGGVEIATANAPGLRAGVFVDVVIQLHPDGTLDVIYDGVYAHTNVATGLSSVTGGFFGLGARTGGANDNHFIDNLSINTQTNVAAYVDYFFPVGRNVRADAPINILLVDNTTAVDPTKIVLKLDGVTVVPTVVQSAPNTTITYTPPAIFASNSSHTVSLVFADNASPTPNTNTLQYGFTVSPYGTLAASLVAAPSLVSTNSGFTIHVSQIDVNLGPTIQRAENQLGNVLIDASTGLPYPNLATPNPDNGTFTYVETNIINYSMLLDSQGSFPTDAAMPGIPGINGGTTNIALDAVGYLNLSAGLHTLGVNSSDGFRLTLAANADFFAIQESVFNGVRAAADTTVTFAVTQAGYYPFRIVYFAGGLEAVNPGTLDPSLEFFSVDANGVKTLINDSNVLGFIPSFRSAATLPYVRSISPLPGEVGVPRASSIDAFLVNGSITVQTNTIQLLLNGVAVSPVITTNSGVTTIHYQPPTALAPNSTNNVQLAFTDSASNRRTNSWQFIVENILTQLWVISPQQTTNATWQKWVTTAGSERGLAYNPKTGHVLLVSRNAAGGADGPNGVGVAVLDGNTGLYIKQLNIGAIGSGPGTFRLNMIDVADDGVIYACNLATSAAQLFKIYRWQDENAIPTEAFSGNPTAPAGTPRWGDDLAVRRSGAGTQIIASGNNVSGNTVPIFTTTNGVDFGFTLLVPTGLPLNAVRLGIAWGCGNTFYGETTGAGNPMRYVSFNGPPSTVAALTASYTIVDKTAAQNIGPIGIDIGNQRVIGASTTAGTFPHSMNLFDLNALAPTPAVNNPVDSKPFAVAVGTFGTGSVDFTPDGGRVYTLDSGSGVIAFSLAPKLAAPSICYQPQNQIIPLGNLGFFGVTAVGSLQKYQWRFNGVNIPNATNATLDLPAIQQNNLGLYAVVITNSLGSVTSSVAYLDTPLTITNQPASQVVAIGGTATFTTGVTNGLPPYAFQWQFNGANMSGQTTTALTINNAQVSNAGAYTVVITDSLTQSITSQVAILTVGAVGTGTGLTGDYYSSHVAADPFSGAPTLSRVDANVDFDWGLGSPDGSISVDQFTVRWYGKVQPFYSQTYTFATVTDDGSRLWVNGQNLVNSWIDQGPTEHSGTITLIANQKYDLVMEYYENGVGATARLLWSSQAQTKQAVPMTQLYPGTPPLIPSLTFAVSNGTNLVFSWSGTYTLQSATDLAGPWTTVAGPVVSPYTINMTAAPQMFFRLQGQD